MSAHPREYVGCTCGADSDAWTAKRRLPQVGKTYECGECGREVYVYDAGGVSDPRQSNRQWHDVTTGMVRGLLFFDSVGSWPDQEFGLPLRELPRGAAIDYWMVEREDWSQSEWAEAVGVSQQAVSKNVRQAREALGEAEDV